MDQKTRRFELVRVTKGAALFNETDSAGNHLKMQDPGCLIGSLYLRKAELPGGKIPQELKVTVEF